MAVSYTHLDVYKRQGTVRAAENGDGDFAVGSGEGGVGGGEEGSRVAQCFHRNIRANVPTGTFVQAIMNV